MVHPTATPKAEFSYMAPIYMFIVRDLAIVGRSLLQHTAFRTSRMN